MEFTTRFGLHSQATRLREDPGPARRGPLPASHRPRAGPRSEGLGPPTSGAGEWVFRTPHVPRPTAGRGFGAGLFPVHSPLLRESWLVSFPPLTNMLKFSPLCPQRFFFLNASMWDFNSCACHTLPHPALPTMYRHTYSHTQGTSFVTGEENAGVGGVGEETHLSGHRYQK